MSLSDAFGFILNPFPVDFIDELYDLPQNPSPFFGILAEGFGSLAGPAGNSFSGDAPMGAFWFSQTGNTAGPFTLNHGSPTSVTSSFVYQSLTASTGLRCWDSQQVSLMLV